MRERDSIQINVIKKNLHAVFYSENEAIQFIQPRVREGEADIYISSESPNIISANKSHRRGEIDEGGYVERESAFIN